jgi:hypothetical protein
MTRDELFDSLPDERSGPFPLSEVPVFEEFESESVIEVWEKGVLVSTSVHKSVNNKQIGTIWKML